MARGANGAERVGGLVLKDGAHGVNYTSRRQSRNLTGLSAHAHIASGKLLGPARNCLENALDIAGFMSQCEFLKRCRPGLNAPTSSRQRLESVEKAADARRRFGMPGRGDVPLEEGVQNERRQRDVVWGFQPMRRSPLRHTKIVLPSCPTTPSGSWLTRSA